MANYDFHTYSPKALVYDPNTGKFQLNPDYDWRTDRNLINLQDDDQKFDGDYSNDEVGEDANQTATVFDSDGTLIASGKIYAEQVAWLQAPDGSYVTLDRIEIGGVNMGYLPSQLLEPGVQYSYLGATNVDDGNGDDRPDSRQSHQYYEANSVPCFGPDTMITTEDGEVPVRWLRPGDKVRTRDHGVQPIRWVGRFRVLIAEMDARPDLAPYELHSPSGRNLIVSPQHRVFLSGAQLERYFGVEEALCPAKFLGGARRYQPQGVEFSYYHFLCDHHEIVQANGIWVETLLAGDQTELMMTRPGAALPDLAQPQIAARYCLKSWEARLLAQPQASAQQDQYCPYAA